MCSNRYIILATSNVFSRLGSDGEEHHQAAHHDVQSFFIAKIYLNNDISIYFSQKKLKRKYFLTNFLVYMKENPYICASIK